MYVLSFIRSFLCVKVSTVQFWILFNNKKLSIFVLISKLLKKCLICTWLQSSSFSFFFFFLCRHTNTNNFCGNLRITFSFLFFLFREVMSVHVITKFVFSCLCSVFVWKDSFTYWDSRLRTFLSLSPSKQKLTN
jgi:hypothetical protein